MIKTVFSAELPVDEKFVIHKNEIHGRRGGQRLCVVTGTHGDELEGQYVCYLLTEFLQRNRDKICGEVDVYPALNPLGIDSITRGFPGFDLDMNRIFPGGRDKSLSDCAAYEIIEDIKTADFAIDIHSSNIFLRELPQARVNVNTADYLVQYAEMLNIDLVWVHPAATVLESTLAHTLNSLGVKTIVVEMGVGMRITPSYGERLFHGILNLMKNIGMYTGDIDAEITKPILVSGDGVDFVNAEKSGVFLPEQTYGAMLHKGDVIGKIVSALTGEVLSVATAREDGLLMTIRAYPIVYEGSLLARIVVKA
ncbi:MAG: succinylglutamate desuccinylase/aspartoacylase family protein [Bacteroidales bacterium]|nr:succinylglutamate desuccinylase/aspartoacylase family protein [Bacteroidales bacterium]